MKASDFDKKFDDGKEDITDDLDLSSARRPNLEMRLSLIHISEPTRPY